MIKLGEVLLVLIFQAHLQPIRTWASKQQEYKTCMLTSNQLIGIGICLWQQSSLQYITILPCSLGMSDGHYFYHTDGCETEFSNKRGTAYCLL